MTTRSDSALIASAFFALEEVVERWRPTDHGANTAAQGAMRSCLSSAAALVDVAQTLLRAEHEAPEEAHSMEWQALIAHTKMASRRAHQAAVVLAGHKDSVGAWRGISPSTDGHRSDTTCQ